MALQWLSAAFRPKSTVEPIVLPDGRSLPVSVRGSARARRVALRMHASLGAVELVVPSDTSLTRALAFLDSRRGWIVAQAMKLPPAIPFVDGAVVPVLGEPHIIRAIGPGLGRHPPFRIVDGTIAVTGAPDHLARRIRAGLATRARDLLAERTTTLARRLDLDVRHVSVGDARTRWGSCAASGNIRYSWRLILAPERVLDYVVAHEVAHLAQMDHSPRFWRLVERLHPTHRAERDWLRRHGPQLLRYG